MTVVPRPIVPSFIAEIGGIDIRAALSVEDRSALLDAWRTYPVMLIRGQELSDSQLMTFAQVFGEPEAVQATEVSAKAGGFENVAPEIGVISNIVENGKPIGASGSGELYWHTDSSFVDTPPSASVLHGIEVPPSGGDTYFCNMYAAWDAMPPALRSRVEERRAIHSVLYTASGALRKGLEEVTDPSRGPGPQHPMVRTHPVTGGKALFLGRRRSSYVVGLPLAESEALLDEVWSHATRAEFTWSHRWQAHDTLIWDNRCTMHRRDAFDPSTRRLMHRTQTRGAPVT